MFKLVITYDGCFYCDVKSAGKVVTGTIEQIAQLIANHLPPSGPKFSLDAYPVEPGRLISYRIPAPSVPRRKRIELRTRKA